MNKKIISVLITLTFICAFTFGFVYYITPEVQMIKVPAYAGPGYKSFPDLTTTKYIQLHYNDYVKTASGAAIAWAVKEICQFLFSSLKNLFTKVKEN